MISLEEGAKRHEKLFPHADLQSQMYKMEEELQEVNEAQTLEQKLKELADCYIVCWGLYRFMPNIAIAMVRAIYSMCGLISIYQIELQAEKKWEINEGRTWKFDGKVYHHVGTDGNE